MILMIFLMVYKSPFPRFQTIVMFYDSMFYDDMFYDMFYDNMFYDSYVL